MFGLPSWLVSLLLKLAMSLGLPYLMQKLTWVPQEVWTFIVDALKHIQTADDKPAAVRQVNDAIKECRGSFCPADTKGL